MKKLTLNLLLILCANWLNSQVLRTTDTLWLSIDDQNGWPKMDTLQLTEGEEAELLLWLKVDTSESHQIKAVYFPLNFTLKSGSMDALQIGAEEESAWSGNTSSLAGLPVDTSYQVFEPFGSMTYRALTKTQLSDTSSQLLFAFMVSGTVSDWSGRGPVGKVRVIANAPGAASLTPGIKILQDGNAVHSSITGDRSVRDNLWQPVIFPLEIVAKMSTSTYGLHAFGQVELYPNPFRKVLTMDLSLTEAAGVSVRILNIKGEKMGDMITEGSYPAGKHRFSFDFEDLAPGIYLIHSQMTDGKGQVSSSVSKVVYTGH